MNEVPGLPAFDTLSDAELADLYAAGIGSASILESLAVQIADRAATIRGDLAMLQNEIQKRIASGLN